MNNPVDPALDAHYRGAEYVIHTAGGAILTRIDQRHAAIGALLQASDHREAVLLTAWNPHSQRVGNAENRSRQDELEAELGAAGIAVLPAEGRSPAGDWCERCVLALGLDTPAALALAQRYQQTAFVRYTADGLATLVYAFPNDPLAYASTS